MGKTYMTKIPPGDFKVTIPGNPLLSTQVITSKWILIPYTNLQLKPYPNTQLDLFCSDNLSFQCMAPNTRLTNCADPSTWLQSPTREGCWLQSSSVHYLMKNMKLLGHKTLWCTNTAASSRTRANLVFGQNNPYICLGLWEKKAQTYILTCFLDRLAWL